MEYKKISEIAQERGKEVRLQCWVHEVRDQKNIRFLVLRDRWGLVQGIVLSDADCFHVKVTKESVVRLTGKVQEASIKNPEITQRHVELNITSLEVLSLAEELPIQVVAGKDEADLSTRLDNRWIDLRKPKNHLIFKLWTFVEEVMREWWTKHEFIQIYSPKFMGTPSESGAELFSVEYFGKRAYLAQSPQFYKQMAMAAGFEKIFEIGPVFRANKSHTTRHDTEFTMIDMEISFIDSHEDVMKAEESWLTHILSRVKETFGEEIKEFYNVDIIVPSTPFPRVTMEEATKLVSEHGIRCDGDLDAAGEKKLSELIKEKHSHEFVFVTAYPWRVRPFYHMKDENDNTLTKSYDLIWKGVEITTGAQREHRHSRLKAQAIEKGLDLGPIADYLSFFKYGCPPHGGFGFSPTRLLMLMLDINNVREVTLLPRDTERLTP